MTLRAVHGCAPEQQLMELDKRNSIYGAGMEKSSNVNPLASSIADSLMSAVCMAVADIFQL